jgi:uncharacterized protein (UPF0333 family)
MTIRSKLNCKGQVAIEYILMLVVVLTITMSVMNNIKQYVLPKNAAECENGSNSFACKLQNMARVEDPSLKYFTLKM